MGQVLIEHVLSFVLRLVIHARINKTNIKTVIFSGETALISKREQRILFSEVILVSILHNYYFTSL